MRFVARWSVFVAFCSAVAFAAVQPALHRGNVRSLAASASRGTDATAPSGLKSQASPQDGSYIGPGAAIAGPTIVKALVASPSFGTGQIPNRAGIATSHALRAPRLSPHLRSIPLLI